MLIFVWQSMSRVQVEHLADDFPLTVKLYKIEEVSKAMTCPVVSVNSYIGARAHYVN